MKTIIPKLILIIIFLGGACAYGTPGDTSGSGRPSHEPNSRGGNGDVGAPPDIRSSEVSPGGAPGGDSHGRPFGTAAQSPPASSGATALPDLDSRPHGYPSLNSYLVNGRRLLEEQAEAIEKSRRLQSLMRQYQARHEATAQQLAQNSARSRASAGNLSSLPGTTGVPSASSPAPLSMAEPTPSLSQQGSTIQPMARNYTTNLISETQETMERNSQSPSVASFKSVEVPASKISEKEASAPPLRFDSAAPSSSAAASQVKIKEMQANKNSSEKPKSTSLRDQLRAKLEAADREKAKKEKAVSASASEEQSAQNEKGKSDASRAPASADSANPVAFTMAGSETDANIRRFKGEVEQMSLPGAESVGLFLRVHAAHNRWISLKR